MILVALSVGLGLLCILKAIEIQVDDFNRGNSTQADVLRWIKSLSIMALGIALFFGGIEHWATEVLGDTQ